MIRSVVALFVFAVFLCAYIVMRPNTPKDTPFAETTGVTRAQNDSILGPIPEVIASLDTTTTQVPVPSAMPSLNAPVSDAEMAKTTANVLAGLGLSVAPSLRQQQNDPMRDMTTDVLSGISQLTGKPVTAGGNAPAPQTSLEMLVVQALQQGQSDAYIDTIVNEAAKAGTITIPQGLATANGKVDTAVLLYSLIEKARAAAGEPPMLPATTPDQGIDTTDQGRFYTVDTGDSLGAIAVKFYGSVEKYDMIFQANRNVLSSPNALQVGQRLAIPEIAG